MFKDKKKIILLSLSILVVIIIVIVVISLLFSNKKITFEELESRMKTAAQVYYDTNKKFLPTMDGDVVEVTLNKLIKEEYLDPIEDLVGKEVKCQGEVVVKNVDGKYSYIPFLDCGKDYTTIELYNKLLEDNPTVTENKGLYVINNPCQIARIADTYYSKNNMYLSYQILYMGTSYLQNWYEKFKIFKNIVILKKMIIIDELSKDYAS